MHAIRFRTRYLDLRKTAVDFIFPALRTTPANIAQITDFRPKMFQIVRNSKIALLRRARSPRCVECLQQLAYGFLLLFDGEFISVPCCSHTAHLLLLFCGRFLCQKTRKSVQFWTDRRNI